MSMLPRILPPLSTSWSSSRICVAVLRSSLSRSPRRCFVVSAATTHTAAHRPDRCRPPVPLHPYLPRRTHYQYSGPGKFGSGSDDGDSVSDRDDSNNSRWRHRDFGERGFTVGIGGPVGSGKTALVLKLCQTLFDKSDRNLAVVTNDIFTQEDAEFLVRHEALPRELIRAVETGGCPHAAIREDISANLTALEDLTRYMTRSGGRGGNEQTPSSSPPPLLLCESGGDNLAANFSSELADLTLYVIDVAGGDKVPRKGGPGITQSDLLIVNKVDLAEAVGADLQVMERDAAVMRNHRGPTVFASIKQGQGLEDIRNFILENYHRATATINKRNSDNEI